MKKHTVLYFTLSILLLGCSNQSWSDQFNNRGIKNGDIKLLEKKSSYTFQSNVLPNQPILCPIHINGFEGKFMIDTGFIDYPIITESFANKLGITDILYTTNSFMGDTKISGPIQIEIGPFSIRQPKIGIVKDNTFTSNFQGLFGFSVLKNFTLKIDPDSQTVSISINNDTKGNSINLLPRKDGKIRTKVNINSFEFSAVLDTGNTGANYISSKFDLKKYLNDHPNKVILCETGSKLSNWTGYLSDFFGLAKIETKMQNKTLSAELNYLVTNGSYYILDNESINLGMEFFSSFITTIDFNNWTILVEPIKNENTSIKTYDPIFFDQKGKVIAILDDASTDKISIGDLCTKKVIENSDLTNYQFMIQSGEKYDIGIRKIKF